VCSEVQPNFCKPPSAQLIKTTQSFERLSVDFKGPLPSSTKNRYLLTIVDEYSRFPFAFACASVDSKTVIAHFNQLLRCLVCLRTFIPIEGRLYVRCFCVSVVSPAAERLFITLREMDDVNGIMA